MPGFSFWVNGLRGVLKTLWRKRLKTLPPPLDRGGARLLIHKSISGIFRIYFSRGCVVSVAIKNALAHLDQAIDKMEGSLVKHQKNLKAAPQQQNQIDLFTAPAKPAASASVVNFDRTALAKKLDMTIAKVEQLLGEA